MYPTNGFEIDKRKLLNKILLKKADAYALKRVKNIAVFFISYVLAIILMISQLSSVR